MKTLKPPLSFFPPAGGLFLAGAEFSMVCRLGFARDFFKGNYGSYFRWLWSFFGGGRGRFFGETGEFNWEKAPRQKKSVLYFPITF
jgi:hypothetical protein